MKILAAVFNPIAFDGRVQRASEALAEIGDVTVVCPAGPGIGAVAPYKIQAVNLDASAGQWRRNLSFWRAVLAIARREHPDVVHAHDYFMAAPGALAAKLEGAALVYDAHELIIPQLGQAMARREWFWYRMERIAIPKADLVIAANDERAEMMARHYRLSRRPLVVANIPPATDPQEFVPDADIGRKIPWVTRSDRTILVYQGVVSFGRGLDRFIMALSHLPAQFQLVVIGDGPDSNKVEEFARQHNLADRVRSVGKVSRAELPSILAACHIGIVTYPHSGLNNLFCASNKLHEYVHAGLPVISTDQAPLQRVITQYDLGRVVSGDDPPYRIATQIMVLRERLTTHRTGFADFMRDHSWEIEKARLQKAYLALATRDAAGLR